jgi:thiol-disulfide isomerase/thioredoxin
MIRAVFVALALVLAVGLPAAGADDPQLVVFWGEGCPHCATELEFLSGLATEYPDLEIRAYEVYNNEPNRALFVSMLAELDMEPVGVPTTVLGDQVWVGYDDSVGTEIRAAVEAAFAPEQSEPVPAENTSEIIDLPLIGPVDVGGSSLLVATFLIALVDGVNPCSLWVLSILLALVLRTGSRRRVLAIGGTFLVVTTLLYGLYIGGIYGFLSQVSNLTWIRIVMAAIALVFGIINLKDYFWYKRGISLTIPERKKPGLYRRMRDVAGSSESLPVALTGTAVLAVGVSVLETPCTAGYPLLWSNLLATNDVGLAAAVPLFALYMAVFLIDELVVFGAAVVAMRAMKLEERAGRLLKLVGGTIMITLAATLIFFPEAMNSVTGAVAVFGTALLAVLAVVATERLLGAGARRA